MALIVIELVRPHHHDSRGAHQGHRHAPFKHGTLLSDQLRPQALDDPTAQPSIAVVLNSSTISYKKKVSAVGPVDSLDHYKVMITASWYRVLDAILSTGQIFVSARENLTKADYQELVKYLDEQNIISETVISKLAKIVTNRVLMAPENRQLLPASYNTLYQLTHLEDAELEAAFASGRIMKNIDYKGAKSLRDETAPKKIIAKAYPVVAVVEKKKREPIVIAGQTIKPSDPNYDQIAKSIGAVDEDSTSVDANDASLPASVFFNFIGDFGSIPIELRQSLSASIEAIKPYGSVLSEGI